MRMKELARWNWKGHGKASRAACGAALVVCVTCLALWGCGKQNERGTGAKQAAASAHTAAASAPAKAPAERAEAPAARQGVYTGIGIEPEAAARLMMTAKYQAYKARADAAPAQPLAAYQEKLPPPYKRAIVTDAPYCKEAGDVLLFGEMIPLDETSAITNRYLAMQAHRGDSNLHYACVYRTLDGRLWYLYPDKRSRALAEEGAGTFAKVNIYGQMDENTGLVKVKSYVMGGRHYQWDEKAGAMSAPELRSEMIKTQALREEEERAAEQQRQETMEKMQRMHAAGEGGKAGKAGKENSE